MPEDADLGEFAAAAVNGKKSPNCPWEPLQFHPAIDQGWRRADRMAAGAEKQWIGAIAFYPTFTQCAVIDVNGADEVTHDSFDAATPKYAVDKAIAFFTDFLNDKSSRLSMLAVALYGIVDNYTYEFRGSTQKNWLSENMAKYNIKDVLTKALLKDRKYFIAINNSAAAAVAEYLWGAGKEIRAREPIARRNLAHFKVREGIGSGIILAGSPWQGMVHPEMGHLPVRFHIDDMGFEGTCVEHRNCMEGLASITALKRRLEAAELRDESAARKHRDKAWEIQAHYLAQLAAIGTTTFSTERIIFSLDFSSSIFLDDSDLDTRKKLLIEHIRISFQEIIGKYPKINNAEYHDLTKFIQYSAIPNNLDSLAGSLILAHDALTSSNALIRLPPHNFNRKIRNFLSLLDNTTGKEPISRPGRVFGLSINETIEWGVAEVQTMDDSMVITTKPRSGVLCDIPTGILPNDHEPKIKLQEELRKGLRKLRQSDPSLFDDIVGIGVSTIGIVDREKRQLVSIARKNWVARKGGDPIVDFLELFFEKTRDGRSLFPLITHQDHIIVQNDASACCLAEYYYGFDADRPNSLLYLMVGEGVNGAIVRNGELPHMLRHTELGHCTPQLHPFDLLRFDPTKHGGCPSHARCFESIASNARVRRQWGHDLERLPPDHDAWDIMAFHLAQLAMIGTLLLDSDRIAFGGAVFNGPKGEALIDKIRIEFANRNRGYLPHYRKKQDVEKLIQRAAFGHEVEILSALTMACRSARRTVGEIAESVNVIAFPGNNGK